MNPARFVAGALFLGLLGSLPAGDALAERSGPFLHQGKQGGSFSKRDDRPGFFDFFGRRLNRGFDPGGFDWSSERTGEPVAIDEPEPTETIDFYQPDPLVSLSAGAFTETAPTEPLSQAIYTELLDSGNAVRVTPDEKRTILALYRVNSFKPLWTATEGGLSSRGRDVLGYLAASAEDGMEPLDYLPAVLGSFTDDVSAMAGDRPRLARLDLGLTAAALRYARQASGGRLDPNRLTAYDDITTEPVDLDRAIKVLAWSPFPVAYLRSLQPQHPAYATFKTALKQKRDDLGDDTDDLVATGPRVKPGHSDARLPLVRQRLIHLGYLKVNATIASLGDTPPAFGSAMTVALTGDDQQELLDPQLSLALKNFQKAYGIKKTGALDSATVTALNNHSERKDIDRLVYGMERLRWLPKHMGARHVIVNQAAFELRVMDGSNETWRTKVIVGKPNTQTFAFHDEIEMVVFNPSWGVPQSIIKNEMLPNLRRDSSYLDRLGYRVITSSGKIVRSSSVDWWSVGGGVIPLSIQQPPSDDNALGEIKFLFPNKHDIYMHDTPTKPLFDKAQRAFSHGCVRVENPRRFGEILLGWSPEEIADRIESGVSETVKLPHKVPVHLTYFTAWPNADGTIAFYDDVYGRDARMERAFAATHIALR